jgi:hypothetical protein
VVAVLLELATPDVSPGMPLAVAPEVELEVAPGPPIELVLPGVVVPLVDDVLALPEVSVLPAVLPGVAVLAGGVTVVDELDDVVGVAASSCLVQAPSETAATSASAAHEVRDAFIGKLLQGL